MKFNFEKAKDIVKKTGIVAGAALITSSSSVEQKENNDKSIGHATNTDINYNIKDYSGPGPQTIAWSEAKENLNKKENLSDKDKILLNNIQNLEDKFSKLSKENSEIMNGSISIVSNFDLTQKIDNKKYEIIDGIEITSPLENRLLAQILESYLISDHDDIKFLGRDNLALSAIGETKKIADDGYIELQNDGYKHFIPEYYIVLDQEENDSLITFSLKMVSSKDKKVVNESTFTEKLPEGNQITLEFEEFTNKKIIPNLIKSAEELLKNLNLTKNGN